MIELDKTGHYTVQELTFYINKIKLLLPVSS